MAEAEVGDEQMFLDPTVNALCDRVADLLGKEAAVYLPSGTMCNQIAARVHCVTIPPIRLAQLVSQFLFSRRTIAQIDKPPPVNPSKRKERGCPDQMEFCYA